MKLEVCETKYSLYCAEKVQHDKGIITPNNANSSFLARLVFALANPKLLASCNRKKDGVYSIL